MLLPEKHLKVADSIIGIGSVVLKLAKKPIHLDKIWREVEIINNEKTTEFNCTYDNFILSLTFLFTIGLVDLDSENKIYELN